MAARKGRDVKMKDHFSQRACPTSSTLQLQSSAFQAASRANLAKESRSSQSFSASNLDFPHTYPLPEEDPSTIDPLWRRQTPCSPNSRTSPLKSEDRSGKRRFPTTRSRTLQSTYVAATTNLIGVISMRQGRAAAAATAAAPTHRPHCPRRSVARPGPVSSGHGLWVSAAIRLSVPGRSKFARRGQNKII